MGASGGWKGKWAYVSFGLPIIWIPFLCLRTSPLVCLVGGQRGGPTGSFNIGMSDIEKPGQFRAHFGGSSIYCSVAMLPAMARSPQRWQCLSQALYVAWELGCGFPLLPIWVLHLVLWPFHRVCELLYTLPFDSLQLRLVRIPSSRDRTGTISGTSECGSGARLGY